MTYKFCEYDSIIIKWHKIVYITTDLMTFTKSCVNKSRDRFCDIGIFLWMKYLNLDFPNFL